MDSGDEEEDNQEEPEVRRVPRADAIIVVHYQSYTASVQSCPALITIIFNLSILLFNNTFPSFHL